MAYSNFTLETVRNAFQLQTIEAADISSKIEPVNPSADLTKALEKKVPLAIAINTEKAKSELIVTDVLVELRENFDGRISFFSGTEFSVDAENGLTGICDFLVSLSPTQFFIKAPIITFVEAKKDDLISGVGQCAAEMLAARRFNAEQGNDIPRIYGATTSGTVWQFLKLDGNNLHIDRTVYAIEQSDKILGILSSMVEQKV